MAATQTATPTSRGDWGKTRPAGPPRPVYGTVRSMSYASTVRKFDAERYIANVNEI
jgi:hypothetical protein